MYNDATILDWTLANLQSFDQRIEATANMLLECSS